MGLELLAVLLIPWWSVAGWVSHVADKNGFRHRRWFAAAFLTGPMAWVLLYVKIRDRRERMGPGPRRSGNLAEITRNKRKGSGRILR